MAGRILPDRIQSNSSGRSFRYSQTTDNCYSQMSRSRHISRKYYLYITDYHQ